MELDRRKKIEIAAGIVFVALLVLVVILVVSSVGGNVKTTTTTTIENSFNTYNIYTSTTKPYIVDGDYVKVYSDDKDVKYITDSRSERRYLRYDSWAKHRTTPGVIGNDVERFEVYVENLDYVEGYFTVKFYFEDYYGRTNTESINQYIKPRSEKLFLWKDISPEPYEYRTWWYEVIPKTRAPATVYYNN